MYAYGYRYNSGLVIGAGGAGGDTTFKITVDTTKAGSASNTFVLPLHTGVTNMTVYWGDGNSDLITAYNQAELTHVYSAGGSYQVSCDGSFAGIYFNLGGDRLKLSSIDNWGENAWSNMLTSFRGCTNVTANYTDTCNTSAVTSMWFAFYGCSSFNGEINWDTSNVTKFDNAFNLCSSLNSSITLNTSSATSMVQMFKSCTSLNSPITFNDTSNVVSFNEMFQSCSVFNQPIDFNTSSATNMVSMFNQSLVFNQPITFIATAATSCFAMFSNCNALNSAINITSSASLSNTSYMFNVCSSLNSSVTISNTSGVTTMLGMFLNCSLFNQDISSLNITSLTNATSMLQNSAFSKTNYDLLLPAWDAYGTSSVVFHAGTAHYSAGAPTTAHNAMVARGWTITDGGTP